MIFTSWCWAHVYFLSIVENLSSYYNAVFYAKWTVWFSLEVAEGNIWIARKLLWQNIIKNMLQPAWKISYFANFQLVWFL